MKKDKENQKQKAPVQYIKFVKKQVPAYSFPHETKRVFAEIREPCKVPSPDKYFREAEFTNISASTKNDKKVV